MSAELDSIISASIATIDGGDNGGDTGDTSGTDDAVDVPTEDAADASTDAGAEDADTGDGSGSGESVETGAGGDAAGTGTDTRSADELAFDAELAELGLAAPKPGQRDNRIPYSRIRKIVANAKTKWSEKLKGEHTAALTPMQQEIAEHKARAATYDAAEKLIETDGEKYLALLASIYPKQYGHLVGGKGKDAPQKPQEPQPDVKYDDGSLGYSPEQFAKLREYDRTESARIAEERATKQFNERFGPIEQEYKATQQQHQDVQKVRGHIGKLREQWGADLIDSPDVQKAIVAHMDANPKDSLVAATRTVAMARIQADRTKMRAELLKELKVAPKAAAKAPIAPNRSDRAADDESIDQIIANAARGLR